MHSGNHRAEFCQLVAEKKIILPDFNALSHNEPTTQENQQWELPIPFDEVARTEFPISDLPKEAAEFVQCLSESTQTPPEMSGVLALGVLAAALQGKFTLRVTSDWIETLSLYCVAVAPPGERKSAVLSALTGPIREYERERGLAERAEIAQNREAKNLLEKYLESEKTKAAKSGDFEGHRGTILGLAQQIEEFEVKRPYRILADDVTSERLASLLDESGGSLAVVSSEGGIFDEMAGRYQKSANFDVYLKAHNGDSISVDRIMRARNYIESPHLSMILTVQPQVLAGLMNNQAFRGRGLCGRFCYAVCQSKVGHRKINPAPIPNHVKEAYRVFIRRILSSEWRGEIVLSENASKILFEYMTLTEERIGNKFDFMGDWVGKHAGLMLRIAALIHAAESTSDPTKTPISEDTMSQATSLSECLLTHAEAAYVSMGSDSDSSDAKYLLKKIDSTGREEISKRDLFQLCKGKFKRVEEMDSALQVLAEREYIHIKEAQTGGRPTKRILVNPLSKGRF